MSAPEVGWTVWASVLATPVMISTGQVLFKMASQGLGTGGAGFLRLLADPFLIVALMIYATATLMWIYVLKMLPLSYAYPFMALSFCLVPLASTLIFGETLTAKYWVGVGLIVSGMLVINS